MKTQRLQVYLNNSDRQVLEACQRHIESEDGVAVSMSYTMLVALHALAREYRVSRPRRWKTVDSRLETTRELQDISYG